MKAAILLLTVVIVGCGKPEPKPAANPFPPELVKKAEKASAVNNQRKAEAATFLEEVKKNPQPLFDRAVDAVKKGVAETAGDDAAKAAAITVSKDSLKTFGPEKWTVRGNLKAKNKQGQDRDTTWEVTLQMMFDKLQVRQVDLDAGDK